MTVTLARMGIRRTGTGNAKTIVGGGAGRGGRIPIYFQARGRRLAGFLNRGAQRGRFVRPTCIQGPGEGRRYLSGTGQRSSRTEAAAIARAGLVIRRLRRRNEVTCGDGSAGLGGDLIGAVRGPAGRRCDKNERKEEKQKGPKPLCLCGERSRDALLNKAI